MKWKIAGIAAVGLVIAAGVARAAPRGARGGAEALERKFYWSLLRADQKREVEKAVADFLAQTAPDRDLAASRMLRLRAEATALLTVEQRKDAGKVAWFVKHLTEAERREGFDRFLDGTDREALARRIERLEGAAPEDRVAIGIEILDQVYDAAEAKLAEALKLSPEQRTGLKALYGQAKEDLKPLAVRIETAKGGLVRTGLALLDEEQKAKFDAFHADLRAKILAFVRKAEPVTTPR